MRTAPAVLSRFGLVALLLAAGSRAGAAPAETTLAASIASHGLKSHIVKPPRGLLRHEYIVPDGPYFQLFDWDMYFMGVALSYDKVSKPIAGSVEDFLSFVDEFADWTGYAPREIAPDALWALPEMCKPFLAQAAARASITSGDFKWLLGSDAPPSADPNYLKLQAYERPDAPPRVTYYAKLQDTLAFWENNRRAADGLFVWYNGVESGTDNNPAVSDAPSQVTEGVDLQCYIYREYLALAFLADHLEKPAQAKAYREKAAALKALVQKLMWSEKDGTYWNISSRTGTYIKIKTWTNFVPLWAGIAAPPQAKRMIDGHLLNPAEFWSPNGVRTLSKDEALYDAGAGYWRGPVWILSNYLMMHGLLNYGYRAQAAELAEKTRRLLVADFRKSGGMNENYDPETGAPDAAGHFVSWNLLAEHMKEEAASGADPTAIPAF
ncbi:MAG TPA: trehalase family glycosidase [Elusimicrobiota bacterium]|nr:trehalase family glycosidase [Elusimicrobiota bacterium]